MPHTAAPAGCTNSDGSAVGGATGSAGCDPSWNDIDEAFLNSTGVMTYITSLFISKQPWTATTYTQNIGPGAPPPRRAAALALPLRPCHRPPDCRRLTVAVA